MPHLDAYVRAYEEAAAQHVHNNLSRFWAPLRKKTVSTVAGTIQISERTERVLYAPNGEKFRVIQDPLNNVQVEQNDRLHVVVRPETVRFRARSVQV